MENMIKAQTIRCYIYQLTAGITGLALVFVRTSGLSFAFTNWVLGVKAILLLAMMGLLSYVHFSLQPLIDALFAQAGNDPVPENLGSQVGPLRSRRKKLAGTCLFLDITTVLLGLQVYTRFSPLVTLALVALAALFVRRAYRTPISLGWV
jgi:hypothetical protein